MLLLALRRHPQALNLAADVSLSATSVRALFADWLAKFKRAYREGDEVRRPCVPFLRAQNADGARPLSSRRWFSRAGI